MFRLGTVSIQINKSLIPNDTCLWLLLYALHRGLCVYVYKCSFVYTVQLYMNKIYCVMLIAGMLHWMDTWDTAGKMNQKAFTWRRKIGVWKCLECGPCYMLQSSLLWYMSQVIVWPITIYDWTKFILVWKNLLYIFNGESLTICSIIVLLFL